ncbi:MAG: nuclear transport factor 2 family protein [Acidobacteriota bacterium]
MTTNDVAQQLVALCREGKNREALETLYSENIVSIEGAGGPEMPQRMEGLEAVRGKTEWWYANHEVHEVTTEGPYIAEGDDRFLVKFWIDVTPTGGERMQMPEMALYTVADGKIVEERFYFNPADMPGAG